jgi:hypothetical protein
MVSVYAKFIAKHLLLPCCFLCTWLSLRVSAVSGYLSELPYTKEPLTDPTWTM